MNITEKHRARVIKRATKVENIPILVNSDSSDEDDRPQARVQLINDGAEGAKIVVQCPCGETIEIYCEFDSETN